ncbi:unnamed protein product [Bursaphelenchus okinawaensis]|uniref:Uncharacterized protein n=1 Tax=Bursaphelenchus okinawaensis TaxID=465554 RepID=A0A811KT13_9BILA|nr:unnamed protein product [Bursaphelenchus okinawaensis]CAG9109444.1 unnamed protein product [Bursaphelenchus okinawaensis]
MFSEKTFKKAEEMKKRNEDRVAELQKLAQVSNKTKETHLNFNEKLPKTLGKHLHFDVTEALKEPLTALSNDIGRYTEEMKRMDEEEAELNRQILEKGKYLEKRSAENAAKQKILDQIKQEVESYQEEMRIQREIVAEKINIRKAIEREQNRLVQLQI